MKKLFALFTSAALLFVVSTASAVPIDGAIKFFGVADTTASGGVVTKIEFTSQLVAVTTGDFGVVPLGSSVAFTDLNPVAATNALWSVGGFTFDLLNVLSNSVVGNGVVVSGSGIVKAAGFDDTVFSWLYTAQAGKQETFSASSIPAPAGTALLGLTLLAFGLSRRNKKS
ncbi:hypothetical protein [Psychromonas sp. SA13A]|uniref:hypothetical protein n=1 Tax=Psychromonas sp. SA13A TaxID=2686346 RepID=UPI00140E3A5F|nr:hypothetical protein [Psychromonas sp. SA13A]